MIPCTSLDHGVKPRDEKRFLNPEMSKGPELKIKLGMDPIFRPVFNLIPVQVLSINTKIKLGPGFRSMDLIPLDP